MQVLMWDNPTDYLNCMQSWLELNEAAWSLPLGLALRAHSLGQAARFWAVVDALQQPLLVAGWVQDRFSVVGTAVNYAALANPTSNKIYQAIGYDPLEDWLMFVPAKAE